MKKAGIPVSGRAINDSCGVAVGATQPMGPITPLYLWLPEVLGFESPSTVDGPRAFPVQPIRTKAQHCRGRRFAFRYFERVYAAQVLVPRVTAQVFA